MVCRLHRVFANAASGTGTGGCLTRRAHRPRDDSDEDCALRSGTLHRPGMAPIRALDSIGISDRPPTRPTTSHRRERRGGLGETLMTVARRVTLLIFLTLSAFVFAADRPFDLVIIKGHIVDGTGSPWYSGDIGIRDGRIAAIGNLSEFGRKRTIDADGKVVAPGFIDMLGQSETTILVDPRLPSKLFQGIRTEGTGEGGSIAPLNDAIIE